MTKFTLINNLDVASGKMELVSNLLSILIKNRYSNDENLIGIEQGIYDVVADIENAIIDTKKYLIDETKTNKIKS